MVEPSNPEEFRDLERAAAAMATRVRRLSEAVRTLSLLSREIDALRTALDGAGTTLPVAGPQPEAAAPAHAASHVTNGIHPDGTAPPPERRDAHETPSPDAALVSRQLVVTISCNGGSVDLVRVYRALQRVPEISDINLTSYNGGRAVIDVTTAGDVGASLLDAALQESFPEGIAGEWIGDSEYAAVISRAT